MKKTLYKLNLATFMLIMLSAWNCSSPTPPAQGDNLPTRPQSTNDTSGPPHSDEIVFHTQGPNSPNLDTANLDQQNQGNASLDSANYQKNDSDSNNPDEKIYDRQSRYGSKDDKDDNDAKIMLIEQSITSEAIEKIYASYPEVKYLGFHYYTQKIETKNTEDLSFVSGIVEKLCCATSLIIQEYYDIGKHLPCSKAVDFYLDKIEMCLRLAEELKQINSKYPFYVALKIVGICKLCSCCMKHLRFQLHNYIKDFPAEYLTVYNNVELRNKLEERIKYVATRLDTLYREEIEKRPTLMSFSLLSINFNLEKNSPVWPLY